MAIAEPTTAPPGAAAGTRLNLRRVRSVKEAPGPMAGMPAQVDL